MILLQNAHIKTMTRLEDGSFLEFHPGFMQIDDGKIVAMGAMSDCPNILPTHDLQGAIILPGFVDAHTHLGMWENGLGFEGDDGNEETDPITPQMSAMDGINPLDFCFEEARLSGVTTVLTGPGSTNPIAGRWVAMKTVGCHVDEMAIHPAIGMKFALGENPKTTYHGKGETPVTRMAIASLIREELQKAKQYHKDKKRAKKQENVDPPDFDAKCEALRPLFQGKMKAFFHAHRADDIFTALRLSEEFSLDLVLVHGTESHRIIPSLLSQDVPIITGPILCDRSKPELQHLQVDTPAGLHKAGLRTALCTDHPVTPIQYLPLSAAVAMRGGMTADEALYLITAMPAKICGIDDRVGSLAGGKDADLSIFRDDPLSPTACPIAVMIDGNFILEEQV